MSSLNIYAAQINPTVGDLEGNKNIIVKNYINALETNSDICLLPEAVICGYTPGDLILRPSFVDDCMATAQEIAEETKETTLILSTPWFDDITGHTYNAALICKNGMIEKVIYKQCLPNFSVMDEKRVFTAGMNNETFEVNGVKVGLLICHDTWWPEVAQQLKEDGAEILLSINASPYALGKEDFRIQFSRDRVLETGLPMLYVNLTGGQDEILFDGRSFSLNSDGGISNQLGAWKDDHVQLTYEQGKFQTTKRKTPISEQENIYKALYTGFRDYMAKCGFTKAVLGISGGIDSALTAAIAADVLGAENVTGILLPSKFTSDHSNKDALDLAKNLGIKTHTLPIEETVLSLEKTLSTTGELQGITLENLQARVRGTLLMGYANNTGALLLTTGNKSEVAVGFCTLYGDMNGGFNIIKDLYKTEVYALSEWINRDKEIIPTNSITKEPTPELRENQKDSDRLPSYETLDAILKHAIEDKLSAEEIKEHGFNVQTVDDVLKLLKFSEHKRYQGAPGIKIHQTAFGMDWRYPIVNKYTF